jgi:hypothetical protein
MPWTAREEDGELVPGSEGARCLIVESQEAVRRLWVYPANWQQLDAELLWQTCERSARAKSAMQSLQPDVTGAISRAMANLAASKALLARTGAALKENQQHRQTLCELLQRCRSERQTMRTAVEACAKELRGSGVEAPDALLIVANAVREGEPLTIRDRAQTDQLDRDASRWCTLVYLAA